ncbi:hypothetical protein MN116_000328 [Schistosoma mekongi]|uniref:Uncharacterized protein n=1 Tax=Schistosoma mekongi TaxID=38744 RepID=A0AAE1Z5C1_SCHME|nr:hypothetical protein MN116_000328 [Schistosoma mekongi]
MSVLIVFVCVFVLCFLRLCTETSRVVPTDTSRRVEHTDTSVVSQPITSDTSAISDTRTIRSDSTSSRTSTDSGTTTTATMLPATTSEALSTMLTTSTSSSTAATAYGTFTFCFGKCSVFCTPLFPQPPPHDMCVPHLSAWIDCFTGRLIGRFIDTVNCAQSLVTPSECKSDDGEGDGE